MTGGEKGTFWFSEATRPGLRATDRSGRVIEYDYDNLQRLVQELWKESSTTLNTIDYTYDAASQLTAISDDVSAYAYTYDGLGRVTQVDNAGTSVGPNVVFHSTYNAAGWRTTNRAVVDGTNDFINTYNYDNIGRLEYVQQVEHGTGNSVAEKRVDFAGGPAGIGRVAERQDVSHSAPDCGTPVEQQGVHCVNGISFSRSLCRVYRKAQLPVASSAIADAVILISLPHQRLKGSEESAHTDLRHNPQI